MHIIAITSSFGQCSGTNTFLGTTNSNWSVASNWSANCVPTFPVDGQITIAANCMYQDTVQLTLNVLSNLVVNNNNTFTIIHGNPPSNWNCGNLLVIGGVNYPTLLLGTQCWMAKNLDIGTMINSNLNSSNNNIIEKYCMDDNPNKCATYGGLYQWNEVMNYVANNGAQGLCPSGWHIPTELEVEALYDFLPELDKGSRISSNPNLWEDDLLEGSPFFGTTGFNVLPGGLFEDGSTYSENFNAFIWLSSNSGNNAAALSINFANTDFLPSYSVKTNGYSIRCIKNDD
ncbi:MAG: hypothetical protein IT245_05485 [Bacteroidia bacterium]|nr:hypothetical protein [Bacteroidia bacterium]